MEGFLSQAACIWARAPSILPPSPSRSSRITAMARQLRLTQTLAKGREWSAALELVTRIQDGVPCHFLRLAGLKRALITMGWGEKRAKAFLQGSGVRPVAPTDEEADAIRRLPHVSNTVNKQGITLVELGDLQALAQSSQLEDLIAMVGCITSAARRPDRDAADGMESYGKSWPHESLQDQEYQPPRLPGGSWDGSRMPEGDLSEGVKTDLARLEDRMRAP